MAYKTMQYQTRREVQPIDGGYAGYIVTEDLHPHTKQVDLVSCVKITKTVGDERYARRLLDNADLARFNIKQ